MEPKTTGNLLLSRFHGAHGKLVHLNQFTALTKPESSVTRSNSNEHYDCNPIYDIGSVRKLSPQYSEGLKSITSTQRLAHCSTKLAIIYTAKVQNNPT
mmetsp:Transcript_42292/g.128309  ORF Transcript_42292/g.128309 Transcript_42292/m.128309 type:complete len:98 (-) Transcript_42292:228-521(-)